MYHAIDFVKVNNGDTRNTWDNWRLIPSSRPTIAQPTPVYKYVDIPGKSGALDLTDYLAGKPTYSDRKGSLEFYVSNDGTDWSSRREEIAQFMNGERMKIELEDDRGHYFYGRVFFKEWRPDPQFSKVVFEYQLDPYIYNSRGEKVSL